MCRSIQQLRRRDGTATDAEIQAAALQFVHKVSGYRTPSRANREAFEQAVAEIAAATRQLLSSVSMPDGRAQALGAEEFHAQ
jgi:hypothetical protein